MMVPLSILTSSTGHQKMLFFSVVEYSNILQKTFDYFIQSGYLIKVGQDVKVGHYLAGIGLFN